MKFILLKFAPTILYLHFACGFCTYVFQLFQLYSWWNWRVPIYKKFELGYWNCAKPFKSHKPLKWLSCKLKRAIDYNPIAKEVMKLSKT